MTNPEAVILELAHEAVWDAQTECLSCSHTYTGTEYDSGAAEAINGLPPQRRSMAGCGVEEYRDCPGVAKLLRGILKRRD